MGPCPVDLRPHLAHPEFSSGTTGILDAILSCGVYSKSHFSTKLFRKSLPSLPVFLFPQCPLSLKLLRPWLNPVLTSWHLDPMTCSHVDSCWLIVSPALGRESNGCDSCFLPWAELWARPGRPGANLRRLPTLSLDPPA